MPKRTGVPLSAHLRWTSWTSAEGRGSGADWHDNCVPDCADGIVYAYPANVRVYRPERLAGYLVFTRMTITYTGARPPYPAYRSGSVTYTVRYVARYHYFAW